MTIRSYVPADREPVVALWRDAGLVRPGNDPHHDIDRKTQVDPGGLLVAVEHEAIVGAIMLGYEGHRGWLNLLAVRPDRQEQGIGRALVATAIDRLRAKGCPKINLQVRRTNLGVVGFYEALGFVEDPVVSMGLRLFDE